MVKQITVLDACDPNQWSLAIAKFDAWYSDFKKKIEDLMNELVKRGVDIAKAQVVMLGKVKTGTLLNSISGYYDPNTHVGIIKADSEYAVYVEYGTGIVGMNSPHPTAGEDGWAYDVNSHGEAGWVYPKEGGFWWTKGQPASPFMYNTLNQLQQECESIARTVFNR